MKRWAALTLLGMVIAVTAFAETDTHTLTATAAVSSVTDLSVNLFRQGDCTASGCNDFKEDVPDGNISFGNLAESNGTLSSTEGTVALITMNVSQQGSYTLMQTISNPLTAGANTIPNQFFVVTVADVDGDNPTSAGQGQALQGTQSAVGSLTLYNSGGGTAPGSKAHVIRAYYAVKGAPVDLPAGTYSTSAVYTLTV